MAVVSMKQLLEAGVHFGHQTRRWNPKMKPYIYTERNGIHIIDLQKTVTALDKAYNYVRDVTRGGGRVLFVGTKKQAQDAIAEEASRAGQYYVNQRWLGGLLTNFRTIEQRLKRLEDLERMRETGEMDRLPKKEQQRLNDESARLNRLLGGIRGMRRLPDALFIIDTKKEHIAIHEAERLNIPIVALVDTNADPDEVSYAIPANDDAIRAVRLLSSKMADAAYEGAQERASTLAKEEAEEGFEPEVYENYTFEPGDYNASLEGEAEVEQPDEVVEGVALGEVPAVLVVEDADGTETVAAVVNGAEATADGADAGLQVPEVVEVTVDAPVVEAIVDTPVVETTVDDNPAAVAATPTAASDVDNAPAETNADQNA